MPSLPDAKYLIVNADDYGLSPGVNRGILAAHDRGIVSSASVMVRWPSAAEAAADRPGLSLGLHVDVGEWVYRDGGWAPLYSVLSEAEAASPIALSEEVARQIEAFRRLLGREPTHLDSHQHVHRSDPLRTVLITAAASIGIPLRHFDSRVRYCGHFYGQAAKGEPYPQGITTDALCRLLDALPPGITELACHPGLGIDHASTYSAEREAEVRALCSPAVRAALHASEVQLISFSSVVTVGESVGPLHIPMIVG